MAPACGGCVVVLLVKKACALGVKCLLKFGGGCLGIFYQLVEDVVGSFPEMEFATCSKLLIVSGKSQVEIKLKTFQSG